MLQLFRGTTVKVGNHGSIITRSLRRQPCFNLRVRCFSTGWEPKDPPAKPASTNFAFLESVEEREDFNFDVGSTATPQFTARPLPKEYFEDRHDPENPAFDTDGEEIHPGAWQEWAHPPTDHKAEKEDIKRISFQFDELKGWLENIKTSYGIDIFNSIYHQADQNLLKISGMEGDQDAAEQLQSLRLGSQIDIDGDLAELPYTGEDDNYEQFVHDTNCSNPEQDEVIRTLQELAEKDPKKLLAGGDFIFQGYSLLPALQGIEVKIRPPEKETDDIYWLQYTYMLSLFLSRLLDISSSRLYVSAQHNVLGVVVITIVVTEKSQGDRIMNNEYDSELGPLAGVSLESEDYEKIKKKFKPAPVLRRINDELHLDISNLYSNLVQDNPQQTLAKDLLEKDRLIRKHTQNGGKE